MAVGRGNALSEACHSLGRRMGGSTEKARVRFGKEGVGEAAVDLVKSDGRQWEPSVPVLSSLNGTLCHYVRDTHTYTHTCKASGQILKRLESDVNIPGPHRRKCLPLGMLVKTTQHPAPGLAVINGRTL